MLALMRKRLVIEGLEDDIDLFLEQLAVRVLIDQRRAKSLDFPRVITASDPEHDAAFGQNIGDRVILGEAQRVPHRRDVEPGADLQVLRDMRQMQRHQQNVRDALGAFALKMMLGHPERVEPETVHRASHLLSFGKRGGQMIVVVTAIVDRCAAVADILEIDVPGVKTVEFRDHGASSAIYWWVCSSSTGFWQATAE